MSSPEAEAQPAGGSSHEHAGAGETNATGAQRSALMTQKPSSFTLRSTEEFSEPWAARLKDADIEVAVELLSQRVVMGVLDARIGHVRDRPPALEHPRGNVVILAPDDRLGEPTHIIDCLAPVGAKRIRRERSPHAEAPDVGSCPPNRFGRVVERSVGASQGARIIPRQLPTVGNARARVREEPGHQPADGLIVTRNRVLGEKHVHGSWDTVEDKVAGATVVEPLPRYANDVGVECGESLDRPVGGRGVDDYDVARQYALIGQRGHEAIDPPPRIERGNAQRDVVADSLGGHRTTPRPVATAT
jgi:hypothetical protein